MARWQLTEPHYLNVPGTKWEQTITNRATNRPERKVFVVPLYLHPDVESDQNRKDGYEGIITVCQGQGYPDGRDIEFIGNPTPGMLPLDEEAKAISAKFNWEPTRGLDDVSQAESHTSKIMSGLIDQLTEMKTKAEVGAGQHIQGMDKFMETMAAMMAQNQQILMLLAGKHVEAPIAPIMPNQAPSPEAEFERLGKELGLEPVVDTEPKLPPAHVAERPRTQSPFRS